MRTPFVAGNWKLNMTSDEAFAFASQIGEPLSAIEGIDTAVCPPFVALPSVAAALSSTRVEVGAQNMFYEDSGAYTGEVSAPMITPYCRYVILGHSERRAYFGETDDGVNRKIKAALAHDLIPIVCVGESLEQNEAGQTQSFVSGQVQAAFDGLSAEQVAVCVVAYEPIWAIGTGKSATAEQAGEIIHNSIRNIIVARFGNDAGQAIRIQYGGSVKENNIAEYMQQPDIDGALVGGAALKTSFVDLVRNAVV